MSNATRLLLLASVNLTAITLAAVLALNPAPISAAGSDAACMDYKCDGTRSCTASSGHACAVNDDLTKCTTGECKAT